MLKKRTMKKLLLFILIFFLFTPSLCFSTQTSTEDNYLYVWFKSDFTFISLPFDDKTVNIPMVDGIAMWPFKRKNDEIRAFFTHEALTKIYCKINIDLETVEKYSVIHPAGTNGLYLVILNYKNNNGVVLPVYFDPLRLDALREGCTWSGGYVTVMSRNSWQETAKTNWNPGYGQLFGFHSVCEAR